ncbi:chalcone isomerase family protein [Vibrio sp. JC009]|uniref:chalcone isomerase family protein n=1 Tax=Vibrio sp. JC009 TaxID=2912314 RepID=UPI0023B1E7F7|nr:chalcone isomerase family protein [Vibrio sp. JC009]WED23792.1 chalcone isomerase family protein [Vibrio sp. JC009]
MKIKSVLLASLLSVATSAMAATEISGVEVPDNINVRNVDLVFNGAGVRSKFFIDLYVGSLFTPENTSDAKLVIDGDKAAAIRLNITSGMITSEKMSEAVYEGFDIVTGGQTDQIKEKIETFLTAFSEPIKEGDQFTFLSVPGTGVISYKNGSELSVTEGEEFRKDLFSIWLGEEPVDKKLKKKMLEGQK